MPENHYFNKPKNYKKRAIQTLGFLLMGIGFLMMLYVFFPLISWQIYFAPNFSNQNLAVPIPREEIVTDGSLKNLFNDAKGSLSGTDYTNANNWFPGYKNNKNIPINLKSFILTIPKLKINNALVSIADTDLSKHLVNYQGTSIPPQKGNAVIFGHSTLPQEFNAKDYKTIFTNLYTLKTGDEIIVNLADNEYRYRVEKITVVDPQNTTVLEQNYDDSYLTLITCTPPGTVWKRLAVRARMEKI